MKSEKFKLWKEAFKKNYPDDFAMFNDKYLYEIYLIGEKRKK